MFYFVFYVVLLSTFGLSSFYQLYVRAIQTDKVYLISQIYQIIIINMLKIRVTNILVTILSNL